MKMDLGLTQTIKQIQTLSPQMYMSMEILCMNSLDLEERIETELVDNVALEMVEPSKAGEDAERESDKEGGEPEAPAPETPEPRESTEDLFSSEASFDGKVEQWDEMAREDYDFGPNHNRTGSSDGKDDKLEALNNTEGRPVSLAEHLEAQMQLLTEDDLRDLGISGSSLEQIRDLAVEIIYNLDDRGYLMYPIEDIHQAFASRPPGADLADTRAAGAAPVGPEPARAAAEPEAASPAGGVAAPGAGNPAPGLLEAAPGPVDGLAAGPLSIPAEGGAAAAPIAPGRISGGGLADGNGVEPHPAAAPEPGSGISPELPQAGGCGVTLELMRQALRVIQSLDPPGIGGVDLKECLLLQLRRDKQSYPVETSIIENHLDDLANNRLPKIAKALDVSIDDVKTSVEVIASLNPNPGNLFGGEPPRYIKPDVTVEKVDERYEVRVESDYLPRLRVSDYYRELYKRSRKDPEVKKFIKKKLESAEWLLAAIRQRQSTLERIAREVVAIQSDYFTHGISHLKPLKMVEVAEKVSVHVSTISRAISGKYMQTPRGLIDMKFFFTGGTQKSDGTLESRGSIINRIKELIGSEDKHNPLSDIDIVNKLKEQGLDISRRTITKYREAESVPSSRQRRAY